MGKLDDVLGDQIKFYENMYAAPVGVPLVIRVDGCSFSKFTSNCEKPFDVKLADAMLYATKVITKDFNCVLGYTQSDEMNFLLYHPDQALPHEGRLEKLVSRFASKATAAFLVKGLELFPELISRKVPEFDARIIELPTLDIAAKAILWRELDARQNAISMAARSVFSANKLQGKSSFQMKNMLLEEGVIYNDFPERFRRGVYVKKVVAPRYLSDEELARIPAKNRPTGPVMRSSVQEISMPNLVLIDNLVDVLFSDAEPVLRERSFAKTVSV